MLKKLAVLLVAVGAAATAQADTNFRDHRLPNWSPSSSPTPPPKAAPEIDPASAMSAFTLLGAGLVMLRGRRAGK